MKHRIVVAASTPQRAALEKVFGTAVELHKTAEAELKAANTEASKLRNTATRIEDRAESAYVKSVQRVQKTADRAKKLMARMDAAGEKYTVPHVLTDYFELPAKSLSRRDSKPYESWVSVISRIADRFSPKIDFGIGGAASEDGAYVPKAQSAKIIKALRDAKLNVTTAKGVTIVTIGGDKKRGLTISHDDHKSSDIYNLFE